MSSCGILWLYLSIFSFVFQWVIIFLSAKNSCVLRKVFSTGKHNAITERESKMAKENLNITVSNQNGEVAKFGSEATINLDLCYEPDQSKLELIDTAIQNFAMDMGIVGIEKVKVNFSYLSRVTSKSPLCFYPIDEEDWDDDDEDFIDEASDWEDEEFDDFDCNCFDEDNEPYLNINKNWIN